MGLHALFKGAKLEVESVIREVSDRLLSEAVPLGDLRKRAVAIGILGSVYENVKKDEESPASVLPNMSGPPPAQAKPSSQSSSGRPQPKTAPTPKPYARKETAGANASWM